MYVIIKIKKGYSMDSHVTSSDSLRVLSSTINLLRCTFKTMRTVSLSTRTYSGNEFDKIPFRVYRSSVYGRYIRSVRRSPSRSGSIWKCTDDGITCWLSWSPLCDTVLVGRSGVWTRCFYYLRYSLVFTNNNKCLCFYDPVN